MLWEERERTPQVGYKHVAHTWALCSCSHPREGFSSLVLSQALHRAWHCTGRPDLESFSTVEVVEKGWKSDCWHKAEECYPTASKNGKHYPGPPFLVISSSLINHRQTTSFQGEAVPLDSAQIFIFVIQMHSTCFAQGILHVLVPLTKIYTPAPLSGIVSASGLLLSPQKDAFQLCRKFQEWNFSFSQTKIHVGNSREFHTTATHYITYPNTELLHFQS